MNTTPPCQFVPVAVIGVDPSPPTTRVTLDGGRAFVSVNVTWKAKDVVGVPDPGAAPPSVNVERGDWLPQPAAATGAAVTTSAARFTASAIARPSPIDVLLWSRE